MKAMNLGGNGSPIRLSVSECTAIREFLEKQEGLPAHALAEMNDSGVYAWVADNTRVQVVAKVAELHLNKCRFQKTGRGTYTGLITLLKDAAHLRNARLVIDNVQHQWFKDWCTNNGFKEDKENNCYVEVF